MSSLKSLRVAPPLPVQYSQRTLSSLCSKSAINPYSNCVSAHLAKFVFFKIIIIIPTITIFQAKSSHDS